MRKMGFMLGVFALGLIAVGAVTGQQQPQKKFGGGFGFGGFGGFGGGAGGPLTLINRADVKKELEITDEQMEKVPDAIQKALGEVLNDKQLKRLRQIDLQQRSSRAFLDAKVQKELSITAEQGESIKNILDESAKEQAEMFKDAAGGGFQGIQEKVTALNKETKEKVQGVLSADQRKQYKQMLGEEFKFEQGFGGFGGGKKFKKKDAE